MRVLIAVILMSSLSMFANADEWIQDPLPPTKQSYSEISLISNTVQVSDTLHSLSLGAAYSHTIVGGLQLGFVGSYTNTGTGNASISALTFLVGPTINFPWRADVTDCGFLSLGAGLTYASAGNASTTQFTFAAEVGKRVHLIGGVNYRPSFGILKISGADLILSFTPVAFSIVF